MLTKTSIRPRLPASPIDVEVGEHGLEFSDPITGADGRMRITAYGDPTPSGGQGEIRGLFDLRNLPEAS
jgi:hypothetical protein